jgi:DNA-binding GntR family transcriptional regulator
MAEAREEQSAAVQRCVEAIRHWIAKGEILPGQSIAQEETAQRLGVSKIPVREALSILATEGVLRYARRSGFVVARLEKSEIEQIYRMRRVLEAEVVRGLKPASEEVLSRLRAILTESREACAADDAVRLGDLNTQFHFEIFGLSDDALIVADIRRLWHRSAFFGSLNMFGQERRERTIRDHEEMIEALAAGDMDLVSTLHLNHRQGTIDDLGKYGLFL